ncbi:MAG: hypothetical protein K8F25_13375 [Fimbriimonadaceae bacterium]|nr:hypothetical protein [Alphaproteobacteria bacterium]
MRLLPQKIYLAMTAALAVFLGAGPAFAGICMTRDEMAGFLSGRYNEDRVAIGLVGVEVMMELFVSEAGTWSVVLTNVRGTSCINAAGGAWETVPPPKDPEF